MKVSNEIKIGITVVFAIAIAYTGFKILEDSPLFGKSINIHTYYKQVEGLSVGTPVYGQGVKIGTVRVISLIGVDSVRVDMSVEGNVTLSQGIVASLESIDILGTRGISLRRSELSSPIGPDGYIRGVFDEGFMTQISRYGEELIPGISTSAERLGEVLENVKDLLDEPARENIKGTIESLKSASDQIKTIIDDREKELKTAMESLVSILDNTDSIVVDNQEQIAAIIGNLESVTGDLREFSGQLGVIGTELNTLLKKINEGEGTLGKLVNDPELYNNLDSLTQNLNEFIKQLNDDPRHFLKHLRLIRLF